MKTLMELHKQGAEARIYITTFLGKRCLIKERFKKLYRHPELEETLTSRRVKNEVRALVRCRQCGIRTPALYYVNQTDNSIYMEYLDDCVTLKQHVDCLLEEKDQSELERVAKEIGMVVAKLHKNGIIHGDLTTSNFLVRNSQDAGPQLILIDFGLTLIESANNPEDKGVDLYVLERAFLSTHPNTDHVFKIILDTYKQCNNKNSKEVIAKLEEVRLRGRKRTMVG